ncbi:lipoprotein [Spongiibacter sp. KMU-158]|uniref:Lipoprotein n=1 Tax=Spongiibacter pelagi TaxID=2760804 RepID=A0A927BYK1_9GAMM|nr:lipoprotein [Spongiibacter pelagi]MBD2857409.1 lipoprotein [Spongiibacter pelagi]
MPQFQTALLILLVSLLCGCGQTGPLVLPDENPNAQSSTTK